jgi:hypothetical protein
LAALVFLIPLVGPIIVAGWGLEITRRVINLDPQPLPGWDDFGSFLSKGFQVFVVGLAYFLPVVLLVVCGQTLMIGSTAAIGDNNSNVLTGIVTVFGLCLACLVIVFALAAGLLSPAAIGNLAATGQVGAAFRFNEVLGLFRAAPGPYLLSVLCILGVSMLLSPLGSLICGVGVLATSTYISALSSHLYGQAYNAAKAAQAAPAL